jgi:transposase
MYLRETKRRNADGSVVRYFQLAENAWDAERGCAVARVVHNFGRADGVDRESLRRLAASILRVCEDPASRKLDGEDGVTVRDAWHYGGVYVLEQLWKELGVDKVLARCMKRRDTKQPFERALFAMVANRALQPYSKLYCWEQWLRADVFLPEARGIALQHLYRAMDFLESNKTEVEKSVYFAMADLMNADVDLIFYDTTSLHFEVDEEDDDPDSSDADAAPALRKRGYSKNGRGDAPQIVIGLAVTRDGLPVRSWVFPGNKADVTTVEGVKSDLRGWRLGRCVFVGDAGMNSEENRRSLSLGGGKYILATRLRAGDEVTKDVLARPGRYRLPVTDNLRVKEVIVGEGEGRRRYVVCHNPLEEKRQREHRAGLLRQLRAELADAPAKENTQRGRALLTSSRFGKYLRIERGLLRIDRGAVEDASRYDGKWVVTSNDDTLSPEDLALGYKQLLRVEACWRQLKSGLRMRPVFHRLAERIQAHVTISVLALLLERIAEIRAQDTWRNVSAKLGAIKVVEYDRGGARVQQTTALTPDLAALLKKLGVKPPPPLHGLDTVPPPPSPAQPQADPAAPDAEPRL